MTQHMKEEYIIKGRIRKWHTGSVSIYKVDIGLPTGVLGTEPNGGKREIKPDNIRAS